MSFNDVRLLELVSYGFECGPTWATEEANLVSGHDNRNAIRDRPKYMARAGYDRIASEYHAELVAAYNASMGKVFSFRFKDWSDYKLEDAIIGTAVGGGEDMQIVKPYVFGSRQIDRPIRLPCDSTVYTVANGYVEDAPALAVTANDVPIGFTVDYLTGIVTFIAGAGDTIKVTGHFDIPMRFGDDSLKFQFVNWKAHSTDIVLIEDFQV